MAPSETAAAEMAERLAAIPGLQVERDIPLARHTRFAIGGPADVFVDARNPGSFLKAWSLVRRQQWPHTLIGGGTNLIVADAGFRGVVLRYGASSIRVEGTRVSVESGAVLQDLVDQTIAHGLTGIETLAGIPGWVGGAVYGNAGAYGHSISGGVREVDFTSGEGVRTFDNSQCEFRYRESLFKEHKEWTILRTVLEMAPGDARALRKTADEIVAVRNEKFPPTMKCAGSIFKNFLLAELAPAAAAQVPARVIREGKVPAAYFLEQVGAKGTSLGGIRVADYHANLVYNVGKGTAEELCAIIDDLKERVKVRFALELEEEVQYVGFPSSR
ncbi:MAG: UDP-N-acetylmuramate dehydrogenase [Bryobacteraceae bacterium]